MTDFYSKTDLKKELRQAYNGAKVKLPENIGISRIENKLTIQVAQDAIFQNMQTDAAAFEAWAVILKRGLTNIEKVDLKWEDPDFISISSNQQQHYQRFLYRMLRFSEAYSWVELDKTNLSSFDQLVLLQEGKKIINSPSKERTRGFTKHEYLKDFSENELEKYILTHDKTCIEFKKSFDLRMADNQLPVGVFKNIIRNNSKIFTGGKSAIDIWGINNKDEVCIFELKNSKNKRVGALSEMLFYSFLIKDVIDGKIEFDSLSHPGIIDIKNAKKVNCYLLAPATHPLIDKEVFNILNASNSGINYDNIVITKDNDVLKFKYIR